MIYDEDKVEELYQRNLVEARQRLASLFVSEGRKPNITGLNGWVYEQTIHYCLFQELKAQEIPIFFEEQVPLYGRAKVDLLAGNVAIEIKALGSFGGDAKKYRHYRVRVEKRGWVYFYLTRSESYNPYRLSTESTFGKERAFFLDIKGDWERFVKEIIKNYKEIP
jgi:hypothetical protein